MDKVYQSVRPAKTSVPELISTSSAYITKRGLIEFRPENQSSFSYGTNREMIFDVNSPSDLFCFDDSYLRFELSSTLTVDAVDAQMRYLAEGGAHSIFREIVLETQNGVEIERCVRYNKSYHAMSSMFFSREHVNSCLGREADSAECLFDDLGSDYNSLQELTGTVEVSNVGAVTGAGTLFLSEVSVGDMVYIINTGTPRSIWGYVTAVANNGGMTITKYDGTSIVAAGALIYKVRLNQEEMNRSIRNIAVTQTGANKFLVTMQPNLNFFKSVSAFPMFLLKGGFRVRFILEQPEYVLCVPSQLLGLTVVAPTLTITNPVYVISSITPHQKLQNYYYDMYNKGGVHYHTLGYYHALSTLDGGAQSKTITLNLGKRSVKFLLSKIQNLRSETVSALDANSGKNTLSCDSIAQGLRAGLKNYYVESGNLRFPLNKPVDLENDVSHSEPMCELQRVKADMGSYVSHARWKPVDFQNRVNRLREFESTTEADAQRLVISADMSRDPTPFSGIDVSLNNMRFVSEWDAYNVTDTDGANAVAGTRYVHLFVYYDKLVSLQRDQGLVVRT